MAEAARRAKRARPREQRTEAKESRTAASGERDYAAEASERRLARTIAIAAPTVVVVGATVTGALGAIGPAILILAGGAFFGTVAFLWGSLRTLGGEAPLAEGFEELEARRVISPTGVEERKRTALRALKDLELEHSLGKIDDGDFAELSARYRAEAKAILKEMDVDVAPLRAKAEEMAREYLAKRGFSDGEPEGPYRTGEARAAEERPASSRTKMVPRRVCPTCKTDNETDAVFCKKCGARVEPAVCATCQTVNEADADFCKKCGKALKATEGGEPDAVA